MFDIQAKVRWFLRGLVACTAPVAMGGAASAHDLLRWRHTPAYPYAERDPSNPWAEANTVKYRSLTQGLQSYRPVDPLPWGDVNRGVTPPPKPQTK